MMEVAPEETESPAGLVIVAPSPLAAELERLAVAAGCPVAISGTAATVLAWYEDAGQHAVRGWLVDETAADNDLLLQQMADHGLPLLVCDEPLPPLPAARAIWARRLRQRLEELAGLMAAPVATAVPEAVWVLAASTGGPAAVNDFLAALAPGLPIALVYVQHIEANFDRFLAAGLERHRHWGVDLCGAGQRLLPGRILVVPADRQVRFLPLHRVVRTSDGWDGPYQPVIDQVVAQLARLYGPRCGAIVFSGLCDDGALGCRILQAQGGTVWVQRPDSCVSADMPVAALATGSVAFTGTPMELAAELSRRYRPAAA